MFKFIASTLEKLGLKKKTEQVDEVDEVSSRGFYTGGQPQVGSNAQGNRTISTSNPSGGQDGDIWYKV